MPIRSLWDMCNEEEEVITELIKPGLLHTGGLMVITGEPGAGKCLDPDTYVWAGNRGMTKISDITESEILLARSGVYRGYPCQTSEVKESITITTTKGFSITGSGEHRVLCLPVNAKKPKWVHLEDIKPGYHSVAIKAGGKIFGNRKTIAPYVLGVITGDGGFSRARGFNFTNQNPNLISCVKAILPSWRTEERPNNVIMLSSDSIPLREEMNRVWGIPVKPWRSGDVTVPDCILESDMATQRAFIQGLMDADGHINTKRNNYEITLKSIDCINKLHLMLLNFGIIATKSIKPVNGTDYYRLYWGGINSDVYAREIGFREKRGIPSRRPGNYGDLYFDIIKSVSRAENHETFYDLSVPQSGNFVANGIVTHNSWLVQQMAFELATGRRFLGLFPTKKCVVAVIETEKQSPVARARWRAKHWREEFGYDSVANIGYYDDDIPNLANPSGRKIVEQMIKDWHPDIFIVDSFANTTFDERELDKMKSTILNYRGLARDYEIPFAMVQHLNKRAKAFSGKKDDFVESHISMNDLRGSKYMQYEVDTVLAMTNDSDGVKSIGFLKHSFCPIQLQDMAPLKFKFMPHTAKPFQHDDHYPEILNLIDQGMNTYSELEEALHMSRPTLRKTIAGMTSLGLITPIEGGKGAHDVTQIIPTIMEMKLDE